ncbi:DUF488 domain-containing protein [Budvicia diplopodorum]|uniref:DUF488 domain-containing protein n=1 Tax=Budvicia diplopodorum TaxID=1119056 RepID=UPI00135AD9D3|nr:DUF488 family protein [Budvicia diplopodorum]
MTTENIQLVRVYDIPVPAAENSFLVDRLWPRGISKIRLTGVPWLKSIAPSADLRRWVHDDPNRWPEFRVLYLAELEASDDWLPLVELLRQGKLVTLLFANKDRIHNQAVVLRDFLQQKLSVHV